MEAESADGGHLKLFWVALNSVAATLEKKTHTAAANQIIQGLDLHNRTNTVLLPVFHFLSRTLSFYHSHPALSNSSVFFSFLFFFTTSLPHYLFIISCSYTYTSSEAGIKMTESIYCQVFISQSGCCAEPCYEMDSLMAIFSFFNEEALLVKQHCVLCTNGHSNKQLPRDIYGNWGNPAG